MLIKKQDQETLGSSTEVTHTFTSPPPYSQGSMLEMKNEILFMRTPAKYGEDHRKTEIKIHFQQVIIFSLPTTPATIFVFFSQPTLNAEGEGAIKMALKLALFKHLLSSLKNEVQFTQWQLILHTKKELRQPIFQNFSKYPLAIFLSAVIFTPMTPLGVGPP